MIVSIVFFMHLTRCTASTVWENGDATENESPARSSGCWSTQAEVDPLWHLSRWSSNGSVHGQNGNASRWTALPELEPMRSEMRPPAGGRDANGRRSMTVAPATPAIKSTISFGATARLPCPVRQLGNRTVSWLRHTDNSVELLTMGTTTHSGDSRLSVHYRYPGNWTLKISDVTLEDDGCYQCQVNTHPPISIFVRLQVQGPAVTIVNDRNVSTGEAVFKSGALIRLVCLVHQAHDENFVLNWTHGKFTLNHDTQRGGVSVRTERRGVDAISWLLISRATIRDAGIYTCTINNNQSRAVVSVHVIQGEHQAAVHEFPSSSSATLPGWSMLLTTLNAVALLNSMARS